MAIKIYEQFAPFANPADGDYPYGSIKNDSIPGAEDGTPLDAVWANDYAGTDAELFAQAGIVPNGQPDKLGASQRVDALNRMFTRKFSSVSALKAANSRVKDGQFVSSPLTLWQISASPSYSLSYANRSRVFNSLDIGGGMYAIPIGSSIYASDFLDEDVTASNDDAVGEIASVMRDGLKLDFSGKMYRVYASTPGIPSSTATPSTSRAQPLDKMLALFDLHDISFGAGGLYAANQSVAPVKNYYPSTLYLKNCKNVHFEEGGLFEGKGELWGDSDASSSLSINDRQDFLGQNGGHAIVAVRCDGITGSPTARLCGSVSPMYFPSSRGVNLTNPFSNAASLGYAAFNWDAWCGELADTGLNDMTSHVTNPVAFAEVLTRREDDVPVGSSEYCGKGGLLTEDKDVVVTSSGGSISDMYANGEDKVLGYAFGAGTGSTCKNIGAVIRNCQEVAYANAPGLEAATCEVLDVDAVVGLTGAMFGVGSVGNCSIKLTGKVRVNNSRRWSGETGSLSETSLVASLKPTSIATAVIHCDAGPDTSPPAGSQGEIFSLISNTKESTYGGVIIEGGEYVTNGYLINSQGWGGSSAGTRKGIVVKGGARITDTSGLSLPYIQYKNRSDLTNTSTYIYHDLEALDVNTASLRSLDGGYTITGVGLLEKLTFKRALNPNSYTAGAYRQRETIEVKFKSIIGLSGSNAQMEFTLINGRPPRVGSYIVSNLGQVRVVSVGTVTVSSGLVVVQVVLTGDVRADFTIGTNYTIIGA